MLLNMYLKKYIKECKIFIYVNTLLMYNKYINKLFYTDHNSQYLVVRSTKRYPSN